MEAFPVIDTLIDNLTVVETCNEISMTNISPIGLCRNSKREMQWFVVILFTLF